MSKRWKAVLDRIAVAAFVVAWMVLLFRIAPTLYTAAWLTIGLGVLAGYLLADLLAGSVHWIADRFFDPQTPIVGPLLIASFREHHDDVLGITRHDFFEVSGNNALVTTPLVIGLARLSTPTECFQEFFTVMGTSLTLSVFATNQFHSWAHSPAPPRFVRWLQTLGLILTPARHARHHRGRHDSAYCVTSGWLNPVLDGLGFFRRLERMLDVVPRDEAGGRSKP